MKLKSTATYTLTGNLAIVHAFILALALGAILSLVRTNSDMGNSFWDNKWAVAQKHFEDERTKESDPDGVLAGLVPLHPRASVPGPVISKDFRQMLLTGNVGRSVELVVPDQAGFPVIPVSDGVTFGQVFSLLDVSGPDEYSQLMTVTIAPASRVSSSMANPFSASVGQVRAEIQYGTGGFQHIFYLDVGAGTSFSVVASHVRVNVARTKTGTLNAIPVTIGASVGFGVIAERASPPSITDLVSGTISIAGGGGVRSTLLPPHATAVTFGIRNSVGGAPTVTDSLLVNFDADGGQPGGFTRIGFDRLYVTLPINGTAIRMDMTNPNVGAIFVVPQYFLSP